MAAPISTPIPRDPWLVHGPNGWAEPLPPCQCGSTRHLVGWHSCPCAVGPQHGGHRTWECQECGRAVRIGCRLLPGAPVKDTAARDLNEALRSRTPPLPPR